MGEGEALKSSSVIKGFLITAADRVVQARLYESDFDRMLKQLGPDSGSDGNE